MNDPESTQEEEREQMAEDVNRWIEAGEFVLYWGNDLWLDADGRVTSS